MSYDDWKTRTPPEYEYEPEHTSSEPMLNPAQRFVQARVRHINDEVVQSLQDINFLDPKDWAEAFDIAQRFIKYSIMAEVSRGEWAEAGITKFEPCLSG